MGGRGSSPPVFEESISVDLASGHLLIFLPLKPPEFGGFWPAGNLYLFYGASIFVDSFGGAKILFPFNANGPFDFESSRKRGAN